MSADSTPVILVVDDNLATRYSTARVLKAAGYRVIEAATGSDALQMVNSGVALVVLDINLPDLNGFDVCKEIRARTDLASVSIIYLSASFVGDTDKVHGLEVGADGYLTHPVEPPVLVATVRAFLRAKQSEEEMRLSEAKFRTMFDLAPSGIALLTRDLIYLEVNPALCRIMDRNFQEIVGKSLTAFTRAGHEQDVVALANELESSGGWRGYFPMVTSKGVTVELEWHLSTFSVPGVRLAMVTDMTALKKIESEREDLLQRERAARTEAERANRVKDDFLAMVSHELRTPLNVISGWSQILRTNTVSPAELKRALETIHRNTVIQVQLVSDLLDVTRIMSGKLQLDPKLVSPHTIVQGSVESITPAAAAKEIKVLREFEANSGLILADAPRLHQIIGNLLNNAVKFTPAGGQIKVALKRANQNILIIVEDTGAGIHPEFLPKVFDRFSQEDSTSARRHGGLGLGLAIVRHLTEMHNGSVSATSDGEGKGARFTISLPLASTASIVVPPAPPSLDRDSTPSEIVAKGWGNAPLGGMRIVCVEDDHDSRTLILQILRQAGAEVFGFSDAVKGLAAVRESNPNLLISDISMPGESGYELIRKVRAEGFSAEQLPALALTARTRAEERQELLNAGFQLHLAKPFNPNDLVKAVLAIYLGK